MTGVSGRDAFRVRFSVTTDMLSVSTILLGNFGEKYVEIFRIDACNLQTALI